MKTRYRLVVSGVGMDALGAALPVTAFAATTGGTTATITLAPGILAITVAVGPVDLASAATNTDTGIIRCWVGRE